MHKRLTRKEYAHYKDEALAVMRRKVEYFNTLYGHEYRKVSVRNQKTRWGSCSRRGNLSFNCKLLFLPETLQDYVVVHELCHLAEFNHSKQFWDLVAQTIPDHIARRKELRKTLIANPPVSATRANRISFLG